MRYSTSGMMLAAMAIGEAVAGPTHAHLHRKAHEKKDVDWSALDWNNMGVDWTSAYEAGKATATSASAAAATTAAAVFKESPATTTAATAAVTSSNSIIDDLEDLFEGIVGLSNSRTSFGAETAASGSTGDFYKGNVGSPYGSNVIKVSSIDGYDFTNTFVNTAGKALTINVWQKVGPDMQLLSGSALAPKNTTLTFTLAAGGKQVVAFQANTQIGWAQACSETTTSGAFATTWGEANFVATGSGYDVSAIMNPNNNNYDMTITSTEAPACTSSRTENYWLTATQPIGSSDGSCYIAQSTAHLTTKMGGTI